MSASAPRLSIIAALAENRTIGLNNALPWQLPADLKHFRRITLGHPVIMGRRNYESIGRPLPERDNIVMTRRTDYHAPGCKVVASLESALAAATGTDEIFVIGGAELYAQTIASVQRMYLTYVHARVTGDTFFPAFDALEWRELSRVRYEVDDRHAYAYSFVTLERP
jgi:dihydrofolate reductase